MEVCETAPPTKGQAIRMFGDLADACRTLFNHSKLFGKGHIVTLLEELTGTLQNIQTKYIYLIIMKLHNLCVSIFVNVKIYQKEYNYVNFGTDK